LITFVYTEKFFLVPLSLLPHPFAAKDRADGRRGEGGNTKIDEGRRII
jgi:hypothetical protein